MGRYGQKTGAGWYKYDESRRPIFDPTVEENVRKWAAENGVKQHAISKEEIVDRLIYALVNEGARILEEGYALRAVDIDIIYLTGYGFPAHRGGPMWYADTVGLKKVYDPHLRISQAARRTLGACATVKRLAEEGKGFADFDQRNRAWPHHGMLKVARPTSAEPPATRQENQTLAMLPERVGAKRRK